KKQVEETLKVVFDVSNNIYFDQKLKRIVDTRYDTPLDVYYAYEKSADFTNYKELHKEIAGIRLYSDNDTLLENWSIFKIDNDVRSAAWFAETIQNRGRIGWYYMNDPMKGNTNYLSLTRQFYNNSMVMTGVLVITVNGQTLQ